MPPPPADAPDNAMTQSVVVDVLAPVAVDTAYSYRVPSGLKLEPGAFVRMPLGARFATGVVWAARAAGGDNLKSIAEMLDWPPLRPALRDFIDWTARWTLAPRGMLLRMAIRAGEVAEPPAPKFGLVATGKPPTRMTDARARVLTAAQRNERGDAQSGACRARRLLDRRHRRPRRRRRARGGRARAGDGGGCARSGFPRRQPQRRSARRGR